MRMTWNSRRAVAEPHLRFDRVAVGLVRQLQVALARSVPDGKTVVVTTTAPIRQSFKTGAVLEEAIAELLRSRRSQLETTIHGNHISVRVLKGGAARTAKLIGFVHNPEPDPALLFEVTRRLLACVGMSRRALNGARVLTIVDHDGRAPVATIRLVYSALRLRTVFKRLVFTEA